MMIEQFLAALGAQLSDPAFLGMAVLAVLVGMVLGAIPGISSTMTLAILMPLTFGMDPALAIALLIAVFVSSVYGGSISAILIGIPGTPGSIFTQLDGLPMSRKGRSGHALTFALVASTLGGLIGLALLIVLAPMLAGVAANFRSPEFAAVALFGLVMVSVAGQGPVLIGVVVGCLGVLIGMVGFDPMTDAQRFTLSNPSLQAGISLIPVIIGLFGLSEVLRNLATPGALETPSRRGGVGSLFPPLREMLSTWSSVLRGSGFGTFIGAIPAAGSAVAVSIAYAAEQRLARDRSVFGTGSAKGIAAPESANSACIGGSMIPMMALGLPGDTITAVLIGAMMIHGLQPGPMLFAENPGFVAAVYAALLVALVLTFVVGLGVIRWSVMILRIPPKLMMVFIGLFCVVGAFAIRNDINDVYVMAAFGLVGFVFYLLRLPVVPLAFGLILGPILESNLRRSLMISQGSWSVFVERPIALALLLTSLAVVLLPLAMFVWRRLSAAR